MTDLEDTFGEDFAQNYKEQIAKRREQREKVRDEDLKEIADLAINEGKFQEGEPHFTYQTDEGVNHDVLLMSLPDMDDKHIFTYANELDSGAVTCPLDYLGEWMSCLFNNPEDLRQMEPGEHYIVIGKMDTWERDDGTLKDQVSPVRGVLTLPEAKELAKETFDESGINDDTPDAQDLQEEPEEEEPEEDESKPRFGGGSSDEEPEEDDEEEEEEDGEGFLGSDDEEEEEEDDEEPSIEYQEVKSNVEDLADGEPAVWEIEEGDPRLEKLTKVIANRIELQERSEENLIHLSDVVLTVIENQSEEEENEEDNLF